MCAEHSEDGDAFWTAQPRIEAGRLEISIVSNDCLDAAVSSDRPFNRDASAAISLTAYGGGKTGGFNLDQLGRRKEERDYFIGREKYETDAKRDERKKESR